ncbi:hypothetical protein VNI00_003997 [Paramarasmius palmivorus]|uniref:Tubulin-folding cofactor A n=1 Tax=Paramarasmius palmivorus TaxID=297713 RepID=A0AAW0DQN9_9AGAR
MSDTNTLKRQLKIKSGATKRLLKENGLYRKEAQDLLAKRDKLLADGVPADEWDVKNATNMYEESNKMIRDSSDRLATVVAELKELVVAAKNEPELADDVELKNAESVIAESNFFQLAFARDHTRPNANIMRKPGLPRVVAQVPAVNPNDVNGNPIPPYTQEYWFDQLIDHQNPNLGTFKQRYYHTWEYHKPGGPIILTTPGESNAEDSWKYLTNLTINGQFAQNFSGATIVIEHRFFGDSNPQPDLSEESLKYLTIQQSMDDLVYFAKNVKLPMPGGDQVPPNKVPWILIGGSYSGALTAWTMAKNPGVFWAGYSSSGVVQPILDFWQYYEPIRQNMPQNCSADIQRVIEFVDETFANGTQTQIREVKANFGLQGLEFADDVVGALRNPIWDWQMLQPYRSDRTFFEFCDALEVKDGVTATSSGWGLTHAYEAMGLYFRQFYLRDLCGSSSPSMCLNTHDNTLFYWTDPSLDNESRSWLWMVCNEVGWYQTAPPEGMPTIVSRLIGEESYQRTCTSYFPKTFTLSDRPKVLETTSTYSGWDIQVERLFVANGRRDPWLGATLSAASQNIASSETRPIALSDGFHCSDLSTTAGLVDSTIFDVQQKALASMNAWLATFKETDPNDTSNRGTDSTDGGGSKNSALRFLPREYLYCSLLGWVLFML